jgi:Helix-turn-helix domain
MTDTTHLQRQRLMDALRRGPLTIDQARSDLRIPNPGSRVYELRHSLGVNIVTLTSHKSGDDGGRQKVSVYVLMAEQANAQMVVAHA